MSFKSPYRMFPWMRASRDAAMGARQTYAQKVLGYGPIAYWPLWEAAGPTAECLVNSPAQDGTYTGVTLGQPGIGDGNTCPLFVGPNDFTNIYSIALNAAFDGGEGTVAVWARVANVGVWTDGLYHVLVVLRADINNRVWIGTYGVNDRLLLRYVAGGTTESVIHTNSETAWMHYAVTWSATADEFKAYYQGSQIGATQTVLGAWVGPLANNVCVIGAADTNPTQVWDGRIAHPAIWDTALAQPQIANLATV